MLDHQPVARNQVKQMSDVDSTERHSFLKALLLAGFSNTYRGNCLSITRTHTQYTDQLYSIEVNI